MELQPDSTALVVGGTRGVGLALAGQMAEQGARVIIAGRDAGQAAQVAATVGDGAVGIGMDLTLLDSIPRSLEVVPPLDYVVLAATDRDDNHVSGYRADRAARTVGIKMVGYPAVLSSLLDRLTPRTSVLLFGGAAYVRPTAGSLTTAAMGAGIVGLARALAVQLAPIRVNALHPGVIGDSEPMVSRHGEGLKEIAARTPIGRPVLTHEVTDAAMFLLTNTAVNGVSLIVDGGWLLQ